MFKGALLSIQVPSFHFGVLATDIPPDYTVKICRAKCTALKFNVFFFRWAPLNGCLRVQLSDEA